MKMKRRWSWALAVMAGVLAFVLPADAKPSMPRDGASPRLTRKGAFGKCFIFQILVILLLLVQVSLTDIIIPADSRSDQ